MLLRYLLPIAVIIIMAFVACEKNDDDPSPADLARCEHVLELADSVWGTYLYDICLNNPWPTELPAATQTGESTFGGIINDTLLFVSGGPRSFPDETAFCATIHDLPYRALRAGRGTWDEIDPRSLGINIAVHQADSFATTTFSSLYIRRFGTLSGQYELDPNRSSVHFTRWDDDVVAGTIDAWYIDSSDPSRDLHLTEGRFDLIVRPQ